MAANIPYHCIQCTYPDFLRNSEIFLPRKKDCYPPAAPIAEGEPLQSASSKALELVFIEITQHHRPLKGVYAKALGAQIQEMGNPHGCFLNVKELTSQKAKKEVSCIDICIWKSLTLPIARTNVAWQIVEHHKKLTQRYIQ